MRPIVPQKDLPRPLYELLRSLSRQASQTQSAVAAIGRGETPDGSGNPLIDQTKFWYKPGLPGGQIGYGGLGPGESITWNSTFSTTKGFHYFGTAAAIDEANKYLGVGVTAPTAVLHLRHAAAVTSLYKPISNYPTLIAQAWTGSGSADYSLIADQSNGTFISDGASGGSVTNEHLMTAPTGPVSGTHHLYIIAKRNAGSGYSAPGLSLWKGSGHGGVNILNITPLTGISTGAFADCGRDLTPTEVAALEDVRINSGGLWTLYLTGGTGRETFIADVYITGPGTTTPELARWDGDDGSTQIGKITSDGHFGIGTGTSTPSGQVHILSNAAATASLWIQLITSQTADAVRIQNAANAAALAGLTAAGNYYLLSGATVGYIYTCQSAVTGAGAWASGASLATRVWLDWRANGPYQVGSDVDGRQRIPTGFTISSVTLHRKTAGTSGSTIIDVQKNGTTIFSAKPTVTAAGGNNQTATGTLSVTTVAATDVLTMSIDQIELGNPADLVVRIEGA